METRISEDTFDEGFSFHLLGKLSEMPVSFDSLYAVMFLSSKIFKILSVCSTRIPHLNCYNSTLCEKIQISLDYKNLFTYTKSITKLRSQ